MLILIGSRFHCFWCTFVAVGRRWREEGMGLRMGVLAGVVDVGGKLVELLRGGQVFEVHFFSLSLGIGHIEVWKDRTDSHALVPLEPLHPSHRIFILRRRRNDAFIIKIFLGKIILCFLLALAIGD